MGKLASTLKSLDKALDMTRKARMERARDMGFDDQVFYHGTDADFDEFSRTGDKIPALGAGHYVTPNIHKARQYGENIKELRVRGSIFDWGSMTPEQRSAVESALSDAVPADRLSGYGAPQYRVLSTHDPSASDEFRKLQEKTASAYHDRAKAVMLPRSEVPQDIARGMTDGDVAVRWMEPGLDEANSEQLLNLAQEHGIDVPRLLGYEGARFGDETVVFNPSQLRSVNAAFDPAKKDSPNLLAGGAAAAVGLGAATQGEDAEAGVITRGGKNLLEFWHGSPHQFDRFDMSKIGTGEGAQAYGHGLYGADSKDVAQSYRPRSFDAEDIMYQRYKAAEDAGDYEALEVWERAMLHESPGDIRAHYSGPDYSPEMAVKASRIADEMETLPMEGSISRVEADIDPNMLLDWDKPLSEQSEAVRRTLGVRSDESMTGGDYYKRLARTPGFVGDSRTTQGLDGAYASEGIVSSKLRDRGIPGIRYLDGNSRSAGEGSYNYVMFDDKPLRIVERGNINPILASAMAGLSTGAAAYMQEAEQRKSRWDGLKEDLLYAVDQGIQAIEMPWRGYLGLSRAAGGLVAGEGFDQALAQGAQQARQPVEQTAYELGGQVTDATGSPALGTAINVGVNMGGPI